MVSVKDGVLFNYEEFKRQFREAAKARGINPAAEIDDKHAAKVKAQLVKARYVSKPSSFQIALMNAEIRNDLHHSRERALVRAAAARQLDQAWRGVRWEEGRGLLTSDYKAIDETLVADAESANWWFKLGDGDFKPDGGSYVERQAITSIRRNVQAARFKAAGEAMREVLEENPTQADMKAKRSQKEVV